MDLDWTTVSAILLGGALVFLILLLYARRQDELRRAHADRALMRGMASCLADRSIRGVHVAMLPDEQDQVPDSIASEAIHVCHDGGGAFDLAYALPTFDRTGCVVVWESKHGFNADE